MCKKVILSLLLVGLLNCSAFGYDEVSTWTGVADSNWADTDNWDVNGVPLSNYLAVIFGDDSTYMPVIQTGTTTNAEQMLWGQTAYTPSPAMIVEAGATLNVGAGGLYTGYVGGLNWFTVEGDVICTGTFGLGNSSWVDPGDPNNVVTG